MHFLNFTHCQISLISKATMLAMIAIFLACAFSINIQQNILYALHHYVIGIYIINYYDGFSVDENVASTLVYVNIALCYNSLL